jgi:hypothetical protein
VRIVVDENKVRIRTISGRWHGESRHAILGVAERQVHWSMSRPIRYYVVYNHEHRAVGTLRGDYWRHADIMHLAHLLGVQLGKSSVVRPRELSDEFRGAMSFWHRHNWLAVTCVCLVGILVLASIAVRL